MRESEQRRVEQDITQGLNKTLTLIMEKEMNKRQFNKLEKYQENDRN